jgi:predicted AlkP superfamily pyrophosphatase or phosphodiesterase
MKELILKNKLNDNMILPNFGKFSLLNIANWFLYNYNLNTFYEPYPISDIKKDHIVVFLVDALNYNTLEKILLNRKKDFKFLNQMDLKMATSVFPSTTSNALTTLLTGRSALEHGVCGFHLLLKEAGALINCINFNPAKFNNMNFYNNCCDNLLTVKTLSEIFNSNGIIPFSFTHNTIANSGLSKIHNKNGNVRGYKTTIELMFNLLEHLDTHINNKTFNFVYYGLVDSNGHKYGTSHYYELEAENYLHCIENYFLKNISEKVLKNTHILIVSDHGMIETPKEYENHIFPDDEIGSQLFFPPGGEMRMMYFYGINDKNKFINTFYNKFGDTFLFFDKNELLDKKIFLPSKNIKNYERIGDLTLISKNTSSFVYKLTGTEPYLKGKHGALSEEEMLIPLLHI